LRSNFYKLIILSGINVIIVIIGEMLMCILKTHVFLFKYRNIIFEIVHSIFESLKLYLFNKNLCFNSLISFLTCVYMTEVHITLIINVKWKTLVWGMNIV